ncbi:MAG: Transposase [Candidatus Giovannonibacteria bacterium GW2011_GWA2_45_21]|uniref:Transposase n=1 Tax=Candidatus Giovannonibacteria bacterium GW2011_GWA2_45_21 TaxID=1618649 RepID=A0A0G1M3J6_9BACT|nr:MAG: Transposase [Candidatus Giovannonibacteria bacterium GW2011_GWA2_45_21]
MIFKNLNDYYRAIFSLYEFNTEKSVEIGIQRRKRQIRDAKGKIFFEEREPLVEILAFCFMPNHIHLLMKQSSDNGITKFMRKFGAGYAGYFNIKYARKGHLFQGRFRAINVKDDAQLKTVFAYIHTNPISLIEPKWKESGIKNRKKATEFLKNYKWSSYLDYLNIQNFPSVTQRRFLLEALDGAKGCRMWIEDSIK